MTSACSPSIYRDELLGRAFAGNAFICEPVHNLVHREVLAGDGVTFAGRRADDEKDSEFLASTDPWFRPVQVRTGPDGALCVVDMYRFVIEHPRWISPETLAKLDVRAGDDKGRIYRVVPEKGEVRKVPNLERLTKPELASRLDSPNGELRDTVQRVLVERGGREAVPILAKSAVESRRAECRAQALWTLDGLGGLEDDQVRTALRDEHPGVRRQAARLAESRLATDPEMGPALLRLASDSDPVVRYQTALSLGEWDDPRAGVGLGRLAESAGSDPWIRAALFSSAAKRPGDVFAAVLATKLDDETRAALVEPLIASIARAKNQEAARTAIRAFAEVANHPEHLPAWQFAALAGVLDAANPQDLPAVLEKMIDAAPWFAEDSQAENAERVAAIRLLGRRQTARGATSSCSAACSPPASRRRFNAPL